MFSSLSLFLKCLAHSRCCFKCVERMSDIGPYQVGCGWWKGEILEVEGGRWCWHVAAVYVSFWERWEKVLDFAVSYEQILPWLFFFFSDASKDSKDWQWFLGCWTDVSLNEVASHNPLQGRGVPGNEAQAPTGGGATLSGEQERSPSSCAFLPPQARPWSMQVQPWEGGSPSWRKDLIPRCCGSLAILDTSGHWFCCGSVMFCLEWISRVPGGASTLCRGP